MRRVLRCALALAGVFFLAAVTMPALAQQRAESAAARFGVEVEHIVSPGGIEAWLVSDSTVPMIVMHAYWRGGAASEPDAMVGVTNVMADMLTEGAGDLNANAYKERLETLNASLSLGADFDGVARLAKTATRSSNWRR